MIANKFRHERQSEDQDGGRHTGSTSILACKHDRIEISNANATISRTGNSVALIIRPIE